MSKLNCGFVGKETIDQIKRMKISSIPATYLLLLWGKI